MTVIVKGAGRHVCAANWMSLVWGDPAEEKLGTLPMMIFAALEIGLQNVHCLALGTGASRNLTAHSRQWP